MYKKLETYIEELKQGFDNIPSSRKEKLREVARFIATELGNSETAKLNFICTHNSRRSHLAQIWTTTAADYYDIDKLEAYSGGTEATAFNPRAVAAIERAGFEVKHPEGENPKYEVRFGSESRPMICFSKTFDAPSNPSEDFAAIMTCSEADANCPFVPGAKFRASVTYRDPKESDGTDRETQIYDERCRQIAAEMFYMMSQVKPVK
ncbi:MAG: protein-tyrosine-phosphatase [Balneolaceae bacterium]